MSNISTTKHNIKILMLGPLPPPLGGISVSFKTLTDILKSRNDIEMCLIDYNHIRNMHGIVTVKSLYILILEIIKHISKTDVISAYFASTAIPSLGLLLLIISKFFRKSFILRKAAGFDYMELGYIKRHVSHFVIKHCDIYLAQTRNLVDLAKMRNLQNVKWYPTSRIMNEVSSHNNECTKFVFVGQVREYKGINEIVEVSKNLNFDITIHIYGPIHDDIDPNIFNNNKYIKYKGILAPELVTSVLKNYDVLLLPTKAKSEGYPGVIFEAYSAGLPIITTRCGGIPEIVDESCGIFVEPGDINTLYVAIKNLVTNISLYKGLRQGVLEKRKEFDAHAWAENFVKMCKEL